MLLTSGQISMTISSFVVFIFTSLLFLSGYILQQQTVHNLRAAIRPPPTTSSIVATASTSSNPSQPTSGSDDRPSPAVSGSSLAYTQQIFSHHEVCNALMLFVELDRQGSKPNRVLLFPRNWSEEDTTSSSSSAKETQLDAARDRQLWTTRRLLRIAATRYKVVLHPVSPESEGADEISPYLALTQYSQILAMPSPGLLLDVEPLDALLSSPMQGKSPVSSLADSLRESAPSMIKPSDKIYSSFASSFFSKSDSAPESQVSLSDQTESQQGSADTPPLLFLSTSNLPLHNTTQALSTASYIHITTSSSTSEPGPEYDIPSALFSKMGPRQDDGERRRVWEGIYERFREARMSICGLDLEPWIEEKSGQEHSEEGDKEEHQERLDAEEGQEDVEVRQR
ncbi:MAG: hypothetical protein M1837_004571 [Sclerophora amabilis]|nr:MAG: hypothetical protein M1837_004571 [Sclerophora amabilis]